MKENPERKRNSVAVRLSDKEYELLKGINPTVSRAIRILLNRYIDEHKLIRRSEAASDASDELS